MRPTAGARTRLLAGVTCAFALAASVGVLAAFSGAIYTSLADGTRVNQNLYASKDLVYLNGGPQNANASGLPDGVYFFFVTDPSGATLLSTDPAICRELTVSGGVVAGGHPDAGNPGCVHPNGSLNPANGSIPVKLMPFDDTTNAGGEYKVWLVPFAAATIGLDGITLTFDPGNKKTDNFKVEITTPPCEGSDCPCDPPESCELNTFTISGMKFYDANLNGVKDPEEVGIPGWKIEIDTPSNTTTDANGNYSFLNLDPGTYAVCEVIPALAPTWIPTTPTSITGIAVGPDSPNNDFGNVCIGPGGGKTLGYWSNKNGQAVFKQINGLTILNPLYLRNGSGAKVTPLADYTAFRNWLLSATATNMAYMLSAQLAAMELNVGSGNVSGTAHVYEACLASQGGSGFISINDLMTDAANQIQLYGFTTAASDPVNRPIQECLKNALDDANNNKNFVQSSPCDVNYSGLEPSCLPAPALLPLP